MYKKDKKYNDKIYIIILLFKSYKTEATEFSVEE